MKKFSIIIAILFASLSMSYAQENIGVANKVHGFYIFMDSQPVAEYEVIGEISTEGHDDKDIKRSGGQYAPIRDYLAKKARSVNYTADGLILNFQSGGNDKAVIIKFKENAVNKDHAKVQRYQGVYVFVDCEPLAANDYVTNIKTGFSTGSQYANLRDYFLQKTKKKSPDADGLVIKLVANGTDVGDVIKFKK